MNLRKVSVRPPKPPPLPVQEAITPARPASLRSDVAVPLLQALITGGFGAGIVVFVIGQVWPRAEDLLSWWLGLTLFLAAFVWVGLLKDSRRLLWAIERWFDVDLDRDGYQGDPARRTLEVDIREGGRHQIVGAGELGMDDENLIRFVRGLHRGRKLTEGEWVKDAAFPKGRGEYCRVRSRMLQRRLIAADDPERANSTFHLTRGGRAFVQRIIAEVGE